jgi:hypothetical protein
MAVCLEVDINKLHICDFCSKPYPQNNLERCDNCGELFCVYCVPELKLKPCRKYSGAKHYFCSRVCRVEHTICLPDTCKIIHTTRGFTVNPIPDISVEESVWSWRYKKKDEDDTF